MYLIKEHMVSIHCQKRQLANQMKDELSSVFQADFYPKLEKLLMSYNQENSLWQIDYLPVLIDDGIDVSNWKTEIVEKSLEKIKEFLEANNPVQDPEDHLNSLNAEAQEKRKEEYVHKLLLGYLKTGVLKTSALFSNIEQLYEQYEMDPPFIRKLETTLKNQASLILRWTFNVPAKIKKQYLKLKGIHHELVFSQGLEEKDLPLTNFLEYLFWTANFTVNPDQLDEQGKAELKKVADRYYNIKEKGFEKILLLQSKQKEILLSAKETKPIEAREEPIILSDSQESYYINNAGLVLLHPFLHGLFKQLGYLNKSGWKQVKMQHRAVLILQYLTNSQEKIFENDLVLNKLLCGVPIRDTINTKWKISKEERTHCNELLESVIKHWTILKKTSVATLQESFLRREAKMVLNKNEHFELTVAQESIDLLLDQLPWGLGMIKTPWMDNYLICNWN